MHIHAHLLGLAWIDLDRPKKHSVLTNLWSLIQPGNFKRASITNIMHHFINVEMDPFLCCFCSKGTCVKHDKQLKTRNVFAQEAQGRIHALLAFASLLHQWGQLAKADSGVV